MCLGKGSTMVPLDTELVSSIGCQYKPPWYLVPFGRNLRAGFNWGKGWSYGVGDGSPG